MKRGVSLTLSLGGYLSVYLGCFIYFHSVHDVSWAYHNFSLVRLDHCQSWVSDSWHHSFLLLILRHALNSLWHPVLLTASKSNTWGSLRYDTLVRVGSESSSRCVFFEPFIEKLWFAHEHITATIKYFDPLALYNSNFILIFFLDFVYILVLVLFVGKGRLSYWAKCGLLVSWWPLSPGWPDRDLSIGNVLIKRLSWWVPFAHLFWYFFNRKLRGLDVPNLTE